MEPSDVGLILARILSGAIVTMGIGFALSMLQTDSDRKKIFTGAINLTNRTPREYRDIGNATVVISKEPIRHYCDYSFSAISSERVLFLHRGVRRLDKAFLRFNTNTTIFIVMRRTRKPIKYYAIDQFYNPCWWFYKRIGLSHTRFERSTRRTSRFQKLTQDRICRNLYGNRVIIHYATCCGWYKTTTDRLYTYSDGHLKTCERYGGIMALMGQ